MNAYLIEIADNLSLAFLAGVVAYAAAWMLTDTIPLSVMAGGLVAAVAVIGRGPEQTEVER